MVTFDVSAWLANIGPPQYIDNFRDEGIDGLSMRELTDADLRELGVLTMGHRKTILRETAKLAGEGHASASPSPAPTGYSANYLPELRPQELAKGGLRHLQRAGAADPAGVQRDGHTVWIDKDGIRAGSQWRECITSAILEHAHFLSFLSVRDPGGA